MRLLKIADCLNLSMKQTVHMLNRQPIRRRVFHCIMELFAVLVFC